MQKTVRGVVVNASYVPTIRCIMVTIKEINSGNILKPISLYEEHFKFHSDQDIDYELGKTAELLKKFKHPITIEYDDKKT